jgi:hypothetical protein
VWKVGPDPETHDQYVAWLKARAQARFRSEEWLLSFDQYQHAWQGHWHRRGRGGEDLCMTRQDRTQPWQVDNVELITRRENTHFVRQQDGRD